MAILVRMFERQKWDPHNLSELGYTKTPANTITADFKNSDNTLSLWKLRDESDISEAVLALSLSRNQITRLDVMLFEEENLRGSSLELEHTPDKGRSPYHSYNENHYDLCKLDFESLGTLSQIVIDLLDDEEKCIRFTKPRIADIIYEAYVQGKFEIDDVSPDLEKDILKLISKRQS